MSRLPVVILGAGPAGLAAAEAASAEGQPVLLVDENPAPGGQIWRGGAPQWRDARATRLWAALTARPHVKLLFGARVVGCGTPGTLLLETGEGPCTVAWQRLILCSGARELLLPFPGWTLPGVTGAGGLQALIKGGMPVAGKRVLVAGSGPLLLAVADSVRRSGGQVVAIAEHRRGVELTRFGYRLALRHPAKLAQAARLFAGLRGVRYLHGALLREAIGDDRLVTVRLQHGKRERRIDCDFLACGFGLLPALELGALFGCAVEQGKIAVTDDQRTSVEGVWAAGESTGIGGVDKALAEGRIAGRAAIGAAVTGTERKARQLAHRFAQLLEHSFAPQPVLRSMCTRETIVCRCEDVRAAELAAHSGWRAAKLQTRAGMGACQGRVCGAACQFLYGWEAAGARPPIFPATAETLALVDAN